MTFTVDNILHNVKINLAAANVTIVLIIGGVRMKHICKKIIAVVLLTCFFSGLLVQYTQAAPSDYVNNYKWNKRALTYYINNTPTPGVSGIPSIDYTMWEIDVVYAFNQWNTLMPLWNINLTFTRTYSQSQADIVVKYGNVVGSFAEVISYRSGTTLTKSEIMIDDYELYTVGYNHEYLRRAFLHEVGHTIGLRDIQDYEAQIYQFTSIMVNDIDSPYHTEFPSYNFDRLNILYLYP